MRPVPLSIVLFIELIEERIMLYFLSALRTALSITLAAFVHCSTEVNSGSQWLWPSLLGANIIVVGIISDTN